MLNSCCCCYITVSLDSRPPCNPKKGCTDSPFILAVSVFRWSINLNRHGEYFPMSIVFRSILIEFHFLVPGNLPSKFLNTSVKSFLLNANKQTFWVFTAVNQRHIFAPSTHTETKLSMTLTVLQVKKRSCFLPDRGHCCAKTAAIMSQTLHYHRTQVSIAAWYSCW